MSWKHLLTASRRGDRGVRVDHTVNAFRKALILGVCLLAWYLTRSWVFPEFNPFSYWDMDGNFWGNIVSISMPLSIYAIFMGQLDWFSDDSYEQGTIISENIFFKGFISFTAGFLEELTHRGILIWVGLIIIYLCNALFIWVLAVALLSFYLNIAEDVNSTLWKLVYLGLFIGLWLYLKDIIPNNLIYAFNGLMLDFYQWLVSDLWRMSILYGIVMSVLMLLTLYLIKDMGYQVTMKKALFVLKVGSFMALTVFVMPKAIAVLSTLPIIPPGADKWTSLLFIGAVMWSNTQFSGGHQYQGFSGVLHSSIIGFYMIYLAFTFGLIYAIVVHFLYDLFIFSSEHFVQVIKNR